MSDIHRIFNQPGEIEIVICPNDNAEMRTVKAESHYGQTVTLDQCPECGGIWFDHFELYSIKPGQAENIELINTEILRTPSPIDDSKLCCPRDSAKLVNFKDPFFPNELVIARCPLCGGFWLNRGEFIKYQDYRQALQSPRLITEEDKKLGRDIARILAEHQTDDTADALGKLGKFLATPLDTTTMQPLEPEKLSDKEKSAINIIMNTLLGILSFFTRI